MLSVLTNLLSPEPELMVGQFIKCYKLLNWLLFSSCHQAFHYKKSFASLKLESPFLLGMFSVPFVHLRKFSFKSATNSVFYCMNHAGLHCGILKERKIKNQNNKQML